MKIVIIGVGAMGAIYAALLADAGNEVVAVDLWDEHISAIQHGGLRVEGASGDRVVRNIQATTSTEGITNCDLAVIATKASGVGAAAAAVQSTLADNGVILTIQNGLGAGERIGRYIPQHQIILGVAGGFGASMIAPGHAHHNGMELIRLGEMCGGVSVRVKEVAAVWSAAGFKVKAFEDINQLIWEKFICNVTFSGPCTVFGHTLGELMADSHAWPIALGCAREAYASAKAKKISLTFDDVDAYVSAFGAKMPDARPSMLQDHLAGRVSEIDAINGMVPKVAKSMGLIAPYNEVISAIVRSREAQFSG